MFKKSPNNLRSQQNRQLRFEQLERREVFDVGVAYVGLSNAPAADVSYMASQFKAETGVVEVSFLPFEFNPSNPFGKATDLVKQTLPGAKGTLRMTIDLKWFVHSGSDSKFGPPAERAFEAAWAATKPNPQQQQIRADFLKLVQKADVWVSQIRTWAAGLKLQNKFGATLVPVLEDQFQSQSAYQTMVNAIKAQQKSDNITTPIRRSLVLGTSPATAFRISGVSLELHGKWSEVKGKLQAGDTWSNDGTPYENTANFVADEKKAKQAGVNVLYWNADMNGKRNSDIDWALRAINVFSGLQASTNKKQLTMVLDVY